ncbi:hypothetical protein MMC24_002796 [Lignoscripta atroalba]|nr:hypothetical protein [Lignoscripta atroalba]
MDFSGNTLVDGPRANIPLAIISGPQPIITVIVGTGSNETIWQLHQTLLTSTSDFFNTALKESSFTESTTKEVRLPDDDSKIFAIFVQWLYGDSWKVSPSMPTPQSLDIGDFDLVRAYCLADKLVAPKLQYAVMSRLSEYGVRPLFFSRDFNPEMVDFAYENSMEGSVLRDFLSDALAVGICGGEIFLEGPVETNRSQWSEFFEGGGEVVIDVMKKLAKGPEVLRQESADDSKYTYVIWKDINDSVW